MKKLILFLFIPISLCAQDRPDLAVTLIPPEIAKGANTVIRNESINFLVSAPNKAKVHVRKVATIFNEKSNSNSIRVYYDDYNRLGKIKGKLYDAKGNLIRTVGKDEIQDYSAISGGTMYSDLRVRGIKVEHSDYPFTVEFEYSMTYKQLMGYDDWSVDEFGVGVQNAELMIDLPQGYGLSHKAFNLMVEPEVQTSDGRERYHWVIKDVLPVKKELNAPLLRELLPAIRVSPATFEVEGFKGSMATWKDFGHFIGELSKGQDELSPVMKVKVKDMVEGLETDQEKIDVLYRYMQQNMRYVSVQLGIGGWRPFSATYVESNKYGDCKALSNFMKAMLKAAGIKSNLVIVYWGNMHSEADENFVMPWAFNHMILYVPSEDMWLECTSTKDPTGYLGSKRDDRNVLLITEEGGVLTRTPKLGPERNVEQNELAVVLEKTGSAKLELNSTRTGERQDYLRYAAHNYTAEKLSESFQENVSLPSFNLTNLKVEPNPNLPEAKIHCEAEVPRFASKAGKRLFVPLNPMNAYSNIPPSTEERMHPIVRREGRSESDRILIALPEGFEVESIPTEPITVESDHARYELKVSTEKNTVIVERSLEIKPCRLPAESYDEWRNVYKKIAKADNSKLVLVEKKT